MAVLDVLDVVLIVLVAVMVVVLVVVLVVVRHVMDALHVRVVVTLIAEEDVRQDVWHHLLWHKIKEE